MDVEEALQKLGSWKKWQLYNYFLVAILGMFHPSFHMLAIVWIGHTPDHHCKVPQHASIEQSIPRDNDGKFSSCYKFVNYSLNNETAPCDQGWDYDPNDSYTTVNKWDLVCEDSFYAQLPQIVLVTGVMVGAFFSSILSDRFGRKSVFILGSISLNTLSLISTFVPNYYFHVFLRFVVGVLQQTTILPAYVFISELFSSKERTNACMNMHCFWGVGAGILALIAYLSSTWVQLQLVICLSGLAVIPLFWIISESVPWLYANGRIEEAEIILTKAAKINKLQVTEMKLIRLDCVEIGNSDKLLPRNSSDSENIRVEYTMIDLLRSQKLTLFLIICSFKWISVTLVYYGLSFNTGLLGSNRFVNGFFNAVVEIPAYLAGTALIHKLGNKKTSIIFYVLASVSLLLMAIISKIISDQTVTSYLLFSLSLVGKFSITACFAILFLYVAELFPTTLRNRAIGLASFFGRVGNLSATFTRTIIISYQNLTLGFFGIISFLAALSVTYLPETKGRSLPVTIKEIEEWKKDDSSEKKRSEQK